MKDLTDEQIVNLIRVYEKIRPSIVRDVPKMWIFRMMITMIIQESKYFTMKWIKNEAEKMSVRKIKILRDKHYVSKQNKDLYYIGSNGHLVIHRFLQKIRTAIREDRFQSEL